MRIATARLVRTFLWGGFAAPQTLPGPELSGDRYISRSFEVIDGHRPDVSLKYGFPRKDEWSP